MYPSEKIELVQKFIGLQYPKIAVFLPRRLPIKKVGDIIVFEEYLYMIISL